MFLQSGRPDSAGYTSLESKESTGSSPSCSEEALHIWEERSLRSTFTTAAYGLGIAAALVAGLMLGRLQTHAMTDREMTLKVSQNSPMLEDIDIDYKVVRFDGSFLNENIFRQDASPRVDAAWESLGVDYRPLAVPEHLAEKVGLDPDQVKINAKYGGGYPANVEGLHHLHCLNLLRKALYYNYDYYHALGRGAFENDDDIVRKHTTHCLDILRQQLMCTVDIAVLGQVWWDSGDGPSAFTDFNTDHKCRNYEAIRQWAEERQLPADTPADFLEPPKEGDRVYTAIP